MNPLYNSTIGGVYQQPAPYQTTGQIGGSGYPISGYGGSIYTQGYQQGGYSQSYPSTGLTGQVYPPLQQTGGYTGGLQTQTIPSLPYQNIPQFQQYQGSSGYPVTTPQYGGYSTQIPTQSIGSTYQSGIPTQSYGTSMYSTGYPSSAVSNLGYSTTPSYAGSTYTPQNIGTSYQTPTLQSVPQYSTVSLQPQIQPQISYASGLPSTSYTTTPLQASQYGQQYGVQTSAISYPQTGVKSYSTLPSNLQTSYVSGYPSGIGAATGQFVSFQPVSGFQRDIISNYALQVFQQKDANRSGRLNQYEFYDALVQLFASIGQAPPNQIEAMNIYRSFDLNQDGSISLGEFANLVHKFFRY